MICNFSEMLQPSSISIMALHDLPCLSDLQRWLWRHWAYVLCYVQIRQCSALPYSPAEHWMICTLQIPSLKPKPHCQPISRTLTLMDTQVFAASCIWGKELWSHGIVASTVEEMWDHLCTQGEGRGGWDEAMTAGGVSGRTAPALLVASSQHRCPNTCIPTPGPQHSHLCTWCPNCKAVVVPIKPPRYSAANKCIPQSWLWWASVTTQVSLSNQIPFKY